MHFILLQTVPHAAVPVLCAFYCHLHVSDSDVSHSCLPFFYAVFCYAQDAVMHAMCYTSSSM